MALAPLPGSNPACAASPSTTTEKRPTPLRAVLSLPDGPSEGSRTNTRWTARPRRRMYRVDSRLPTSSSELTKTTALRGLQVELPQRPQGEDHLCQTALHV